MSRTRFELKVAAKISTNTEGEKNEIGTRKGLVLSVFVTREYRIASGRFDEVGIGAWRRPISGRKWNPGNRDNDVSSYLSVLLYLTT